MRVGRAAAMPDFTALVERVGPAVVNVTTRRTAVTPASSGAAPPGGDPLLEFFRRFMEPPGGNGVPGPDPRGGGGGVGSGFIIDAEGYILTNAHVVADADEVVVRMADSPAEFKARVVGTDLQTDIALLKIDGRNLPVAPLGGARTLKPGEWVAAIRSPFGFANTITAGIVSATERALPNENYVPFIQTDVAVNPGNSGGPLLDVSGHVVGINSQIYSRTGGYMGVSFAIPITVATDIAAQLRRDGQVTRGRLGVGIQPLSPELAQSFKFVGAVRGALVTAVEPGGPAQKAGLQPGDIITRFNDQEVNQADRLPRLVAGAAPGQPARVEVWRNGSSSVMTVTVGRMESAAQRRESPASAPTGGPAGRLGLALSELPPVARRALGIDYGLVVRDLGPPNTGAPLQPGDVIVAVSNQRFGSLAEFNKHVAAAPAGSTLALLVRRGEASLFVPVTVAAG